MLKQIKKIVSFILALVILTGFCVNGVLANNLQSLTSEKVKTNIENIGVKSENIVEIKLNNKQKYRGFIRVIEPDKFVILVREKGAIKIGYSDVIEIKQSLLNKDDLREFYVIPVFTGKSLSPTDVKFHIDRIYNNKNIVEVKLRGKKYKGTIDNVNTDEFIILDKKKGSKTISYQEVQEFKETTPTDERLSTKSNRAISKYLIYGGLTVGLFVVLALLAPRT